ncbi:putative RNA helicase [Helianthus annuus]|uniref:RNA helicase n=1 Tax=Helianthus annuus TaxID=4232 RepID=A0A9K3NBY0_HELAN|nr:putative RNA helicase [Helianthus annuus]KAJ0537873.1 putative RNA helicase [Helianthus annuus]KAJ0545560.1 putative RNA helicase [Helianthus annuus]KAJ0552460.1 putative RNA helicase [Helianthus annuus]KAJ0718162.1 putative RNA helicase [Helianthus annuus]
MCFRLYIADYLDCMDDNTVPEIQRTDLANVVLSLKALGFHELVKSDFMDPPPNEALHKAFKLLHSLSALEEGSDQLTQLGKKMARIPLDPMLSRMIVASDKYKCSNEIISIVAMLSVGSSIFYGPKDDKVRVMFEITWHCLRYVGRSYPYECI